MRKKKRGEKKERERESGAKKKKKLEICIFQKFYFYERDPLQKNE